MIVNGGSATLYIGGEPVGQASDVSVSEPAEYAYSVLAVFSNERPFLGNGATFEMQFDSIRFPPPLTRRQRCKRGYPHVLDTMRRVVALLSLGLPDEARAVRAALWNTPKKKSKQRSLAHRMARALRQIDGRR